ncbi:MAG: peptidylprolyl isomerase [Elusimicrobia bacterium]|nr:peptidylprolyl isomerase [Elusimicrobiota bacterium]
MRRCASIYNFKGQGPGTGDQSESLEFLIAKTTFLFFCLLTLNFVHAEVLEKTLATVNGEALYQSDYDSNLSNVLDDLKKSNQGGLNAPQTKEIRSKVFQQMVDDMLLLQEAKKLGLKVFAKDVENGVNEVKGRFKKDEEGRPVADADAEKMFQAEIKRQRLTYEDFEERIRKQLLVIKLIDSQIKAKITPPAEPEVKEFFSQLKALMASSATVVESKILPEDRDDALKLAQLLRDRSAERVRARHILIKVLPGASMADKSKALNAVKDIRKQIIEKGEDFAEMAVKHSEDVESKAKGGDLGYFIRGWMVPAFEEAAFGMPVGEVSQPVESEFGYHLIVVEEKRAPTPVRFMEVQEDLTQFLHQRSFQKKLKALVEGLRHKATIKVIQDPGATAEMP